MPVVMSFSTAQVIDSTNSGLDGISVKVTTVLPGAAVSAVSSAASAGAVRFAHMRPVSSREMSFFMTGVLSETGGAGDAQELSTACGNFRWIGIYSVANTGKNRLSR